MISSIFAKLVMLCMAGVLGCVLWLLVCVFTKRKKKPCLVACTACIGGFVVFTLVGALTGSYATCAHDFQLVETQEADCKKSGKKIYRCPLCGMERKENIPALGHEMVEAGLTEATYAEEGERVMRCLRCGHEERERLKKLTVSKNAQRFAEKNKADVALSQNFDDVLKEMGHEAGVSDIHGWEKATDWAAGECYNAWWYDMSEDEYHFLLLYVSKGKIVSIYNNADANRELLYESKDAQSVKQPGDGSIRLVDGDLGEYGREVTIPSKTYGEYTYTWYMVPAGTYKVKNEMKLATVFVVSDANSEDVRQTLQLNTAVETGEITVSDGTHIELAAYTEVLLTPVK